MFEKDVVLGFIARDNEQVFALYVARAMRVKGIGKGLLKDAKQVRQRLEL